MTPAPRRATAVPLPGVVLCCHGGLAEGLRTAAEMIAGPQPQLASVGIAPGDSRAKITAALRAAVAAVDGGAGALVVTDMPGGTPCNLVVTGLEKEAVEMIAGASLPVVLKALTGRRAGEPLARLAEAAVEYGRRHMVTGRALTDPCRGGD